MPPILDVNNSSNWVHAYNATLYGSTVPTVPPTYLPIPMHSIATPFYKRTLAIGASSTQTKPTWRFAFWLIGMVKIPQIGLAEIATIPVFLGLNLVRLPNLHNEFLLKVRFPKWHKEMNFDIWQYIGSETDS